MLTTLFSKCAKDKKQNIQPYGLRVSVYEPNDWFQDKLVAKEAGLKA